jgi:Flp pilus assembly pilin Flp
MWTRLKLEWSLSTRYASQKAQTMVEYALIIGFLVLICIVTLQSFVNPVKSNFSKISSALQNET